MTEKCPTCGTEVAGIGIIGRENIIKIIPNLAATHPDTRFQLYREYKPKTDIIEITVFYREPNCDKMRIDAEWNLSNLSNLSRPVEDGIDHTVTKIVYWGSAVRTTT